MSIENLLLRWKKCYTVCATALSIFLGNIQIFNIYGQWQSVITRLVKQCGHFSVNARLISPTTYVPWEIQRSVSEPIPNSGLTYLWHACPKWHAVRFPWHAALTVVPIFFNFSARPPSLHCEEHVCTILISDCVEILHELPLLPHDTVSETLLYKSGAVRSAEWYLSLGCRPDGGWANMWHWTKRFTIFFSNRK
jgi:hypothetical protein